MGDMADWALNNALMPDDDGNDPCPRCDGSGRIGRSKCRACAGSGYEAAQPKEIVRQDFNGEFLPAQPKEESR